MRTQKKLNLAQRRHWRVRKKVSGTGERPRMTVAFTGEHIYVQFIDDVNGTTLASTSTRAKSTPDREKLAANVESAKKIGALAKPDDIRFSDALLYGRLRRHGDEHFGAGQ